MIIDTKNIFFIFFLKKWKHHINITEENQNEFNNLLNLIIIIINIFFI